MKPSVQEIHPMLEGFKCPGGLFDVEPHPADMHVGKMCRFRNPRPMQAGTFRIVCLQKNYRGDVCYRIDVPWSPIGDIVCLDEVEVID